MHANVSTLRQSSDAVELAAMREAAVQLRGYYQHVTPRATYDSLIQQYRREISNAAIDGKCSLLLALLRLRQVKRPDGIPRETWKTQQEVRLVAWLEMDLQMGWRVTVK